MWANMAPAAAACFQLDDDDKEEEGEGDDVPLLLEDVTFSRHRPLGLFPQQPLGLSESGTRQGCKILTGIRTRRRRETSGEVRERDERTK